MISSISLLSATEGDQDFLYRVYASTRQEELSLVPWTDDQKDAFLRQQFDAQHKYYHEQFADAQFQLIMRGDDRIGRLYVRRLADELRIVDIALLPEFRGQGIGGELLRDLIEEAHGEAKPVRIHVEKNNPALRLYYRLGFQVVEDAGVYHLMECPSGKGISSVG